MKIWKGKLSVQPFFDMIDCFKKFVIAMVTLKTLSCLMLLSDVELEFNFFWTNSYFSFWLKIIEKEIFKTLLSSFSFVVQKINKQNRMFFKKAQKILNEFKKLSNCVQISKNRYFLSRTKTFESLQNNLTKITIKQISQCHKLLLIFTLT